MSDINLADALSRITRLEDLIRRMDEWCLAHEGVPVSYFAEACGEGADAAHWDEIVAQAKA